MKKVFLTMVITTLVILVIGNGLGLVYLSYKCDKSNEEIDKLKLALAENGIKVSDINSSNIISESVRIEENETPIADKVEKLEDNEEYKKYLDLGLENIDKVERQLPNYYAFMALVNMTECDYEEILDKEIGDDKELIEDKSKEYWKDITVNLPKDIFKIMNADVDIETKLDEIDKYGYLAYPVLDNINESLKNDDDIKYKKCEIT